MYVVKIEHLQKNSLTPCQGGHSTLQWQRSQVFYNQPLGGVILLPTDLVVVYSNTYCLFERLRLFNSVLENAFHKNIYSSRLGQQCASHHRQPAQLLLSGSCFCLKNGKAGNKNFLVLKAPQCDSL